MLLLLSDAPFVSVGLPVAQCTTRPKKSLVSRVSSKFEQFPSDCLIIRITNLDANMCICFICEQSISEDEKPVGARGRQTLLKASVTRIHSDHEKLLLSDETVRAANKGIYMFVIN
jgi:hypothetical protein